MHQNLPGDKLSISHSLKSRRKLHPRKRVLLAMLWIVAAMLCAGPRVSHAQLWDRVHKNVFSGPNDRDLEAPHCWDSLQGGLVAYVSDDVNTGRTHYVRLNRFGDTIWTRKNLFNVVGTEHATSLCRLPNGDFMIAAIIDSLISGVFRPSAYVLKRIDSMGNTIFTRVINSDLPNGVGDFRVTNGPAGGYYIINSAWKPFQFYAAGYGIDSTRSKLIVERYDAANTRVAADSVKSGGFNYYFGSTPPCPGTITWNSNRKQYLYSIFMYDARPARDGGLFCLLLRDTARSFSRTACAFVTKPNAVVGGYVVKYNQALGQQWLTNLATALSLPADSMFWTGKLIPTSDSGVIVIGTISDTTNFVIGYAKIAVKLNKAGLPTKIMRSPANVYFTNAVEASDGNYIFETQAEPVGPGINYPGLLRTDKQFRILRYHPLPMGADPIVATRNYCHLEGLTANQYGGAFAPYFRDTARLGARNRGLAASISFDSSLNIHPASINGTVILDRTKDCITNGIDKPLKKRIITVTDVTPGTRWYAYADSSGNWTRSIPLGTYNVQHYLDDNKVAECPAAGFPSVAATSAGKHSGYHFYDTLKADYVDMQVALSGNAYVPGFSSPLHVWVTNNSSMIRSDTLRVTRPSTLGFVSATPTPWSMSGNTLVWVLNMVPDSIAHITINVSVPSTTSVGTALSFIGRINVPGDSNSVNNIDTFEKLVVSSFDPNAKLINRPLKTSAGKDWIYTIQFQNTGNYPAQDVVITDRIDARLDPASFRLLDASHGMPKVNWKEGNLVEFRFDRIQLPDSVHNEPGSHGYVSFAINPGANAHIGDTIRNLASIYFDYNAPVLTNTTVNVLSSVKQNPKVAVGSSWAAAEFSAWPNPVRTRLHISSKQAGSLALYDLQGRRLAQYIIARGQQEITLPASLAAGVYVLQGISSDGAGMGTLRIVTE